MGECAAGGEGRQPAREHRREDAPKPVDRDASLKIVLLGGDPSLLESLRSSFPGALFERVTGAEQAAAVADADALIGIPSREVFRAAKQVRWIHNYGTGVDPIEAVPELVDSDVTLTNARGPHTGPMADHIFAQLLALVHQVPRMWDDQRGRRWDTRAYDARLVELEGKTMGVIALGGIGTKVAHRANGFGMNVRAVDLHPERLAPPPFVQLAGSDGLDDLLEASDVVAVTAPLTRATRGMLDRRRIALMKEGAYLIVVSRGGIVEEDALIEALRSGRLAGAGLDVTAREPLPPDNPLWDTPNLLISPHASALTPEMWEGRRQILFENVRRWLAGESFDYVVDKEEGF